MNPQQLTYMIEWIESLEDLHQQIAIEGHVYYIAYWDDEPCGYISVEQQEADVFHLQKIYGMPGFQGKGIGKDLFLLAISHIKSEHPTPCLMELNVNRNNKALQFYERMGMKCLREGDFDIGNGYYMNDYIMEKEFDS